MPLDKLNAALIAAIQNGTPEYTNPAAILTDKLNIGRRSGLPPSARRGALYLRGSGRSFGQMNFSLDRARRCRRFPETCSFPSQLQRLPYGARRLYGRYRSGYAFLPGGVVRCRWRSRLSPETRSRGCFTCATKD